MDWLQTTYAAVLTACLGFITFLVRKIFTSEKKIEILESRFTGMEALEDDIRELRQDVKDILMKMNWPMSAIVHT